MNRARALLHTAVACVLILVVAEPTFASTFTVNSVADASDAAPGDSICNDGTGSCTLRAAIQEANAIAGPDTINVPAGIYTLTLGSELTISSELTLNGTGMGTTFVQSETAPGAATFRVFNVAGGNVSITDMTVRHGSTDAGYGGSGILLFDGTLTLDRMEIVRNNGTEPYGHKGAISVWSGTLILINSVVHDNGNISGQGQGGGVFNLGGTISVQHSTVTGNRGGSGGGIFNFRGSLTLFDSTIAENTSVYGGGINAGTGSSQIEIFNSAVLRNTSSQYGGGILNRGFLAIVDSTIAGNQGGGVYNQEGSFTLTRSTISGNSGAGIRNMGRGTFIAANSTISGNSWTRAGGIYNFRGIVALTHSTIADNEATLGLGPGGVENNNGTVTLANTMLATNVSTDGPDCSGSITSLGYNLVGNDLNCGFSPAAGDLMNVAPRIGPLADNGGPTETHALVPNSPAIDAAAATCLSTDQREVTRPQGVACDIGAYELVPPPDPLHLLAELMAHVASLGLPQGIESSLLVKLNTATLILGDLQPNNDHAAANVLGAFIQYVEAQYGKKISASDADELIEAADQIIELLSEDLGISRPGFRRRVFSPGRRLGLNPQEPE